MLTGVSCSACCSCSKNSMTAARIRAARLSSKGNASFSASCSSSEPFGGKNSRAVGSSLWTEARVMKKDRAIGNEKVDSPKSVYEEIVVDEDFETFSKSIALFRRNEIYVAPFYRWCES